MAEVAQTLSELTCDEFQKLCKQLVSRGSLKEGKYSTTEELLTLLTSSLGKEEAHKVIDASLEEIGYRAKKQSTDKSARRELGELRPWFMSEASFLLVDYLSDVFLDSRDRNRLEYRLSRSDRRERARCLIDQVIFKGEDASRKMLSFLRESKPFHKVPGDTEQIRLRELEPEFISWVSSSRLHELLRDLRVSHVLSPSEMQRILCEGPDIREQASSLIHLVSQKGPEESRKMLSFLTERDPPFFNVQAGTSGTSGTSSASTDAFFSGESGFEQVVDKTLIESPVFRRPQYVSRKLLFRLMNSLEEDHILSSEQRSMIMSSNSDIRSMAFHLNHLVDLKGQDARRMMTSHLRHLEPQLYGCRLVDQYKDMLIDMVEDVQDVDLILHDLNVRGLAVSDEIKAIGNTKEKMSKVIDNLKSVEEKRIFYTSLREWLPNETHTILVKMETESSLMEGNKSKYFEMVEAKWFTENATVAKDEWVKKEPEVSHDGDGTWYSFSSVPGKFECSVSGLRWISQDSLISFKYRFGRWWEHDHTIKSLQYMPAGPLLDIIVTDGQFDEVYLPHWICTTVNPTILENFAVLHSDTDGVTVEKVSEVTPTHVKLPDPVFSARGVLLWLLHWVGFPVSLKCKVLIFRTTKTFLTLHVYLIPSDSALEEELHKKAKEKGYESIDKPYPKGTLLMDDQFKLKSDVDGAEIDPSEFTLTYESWDPNYFEVFIEQPRDKFTLKLENSAGTAWSCGIRQFDYSSVGDPVPEVSTYDAELLRVRSVFVDGVSPEVINQLMDDLLGVYLNDGEKNAITKGNMIPVHRARELIDTIRMKGPEASGRMIYHLKLRDPTLHGLLGLPSAPRLEVAKLPQARRI
ncbi:uncharacterized protein LOC144025344 [Festucalex cinctus]